MVRPVRFEMVAARNDTASRTYSGTARAQRETDLSFRVGGTLLDLPVNVGSNVQRGDPVAVLDATDFQVRLDEARAGLARAEAEQRNADAGYERTRDLYENQNASRTQLDGARAQAESAAAQYRAAAQQVEAARLQLTYTRLTAPEACTVAQTFAEVNQNVSPGQAVARLNCGQCAEIVVAVPDADISLVTEGMRVTGKVNALPDTVLTGTVSEVGVATATRGSTYPVTVALSEGCPGVRSGMAVDVTFDFPTAGSGQGVSVPFVAVGEDLDGNFVYVLEPVENDLWRATRRSVRAGGVSADGVVVVEGLQVGERIATAGVRRLTPGQIVTLLDDGKAP